MHIKRHIATTLRRLAQWLDPQPIQTEMIHLAGPAPKRHNYYGVPMCYYWLSQDTIKLFPIPSASVRSFGCYVDPS
jgi:hypothetical protein